jgi:hypothetical protein
MGHLHWYKLEQTMPILRCTTKLLAEIDNGINPIPPNPSPFGDWYGHIFSIDRRKCIIFINEPTLFVCFAAGVNKAQYRNIAQYFVEVLKSTLQITSFTAKETECILGFHADLTIGKTINRSTMGSLNNRVTDTKCMVDYFGSLEDCKEETITTSLNQTPMKAIGYSSGLEKMKCLVGETMKRG